MSFKKKWTLLLRRFITSKHGILIKDLVNKAITIKKSASEKGSEADSIDDNLLLIEQEIDNKVLSLYRI